MGSTAATPARKEAPGPDGYRAGRHAEALKAWEEAHALFPSDRTVQVNIETLKRKLGQA